MFNSESHASICVTGPSRKSSACLPPINANKARESDQRSANTLDGSEDHDSHGLLGQLADNEHADTKAGTDT